VRHAPNAGRTGGNAGRMPTPLHSNDSCEVISMTSMTLSTEGGNKLVAVLHAELKPYCGNAGGCHPLTSRRTLVTHLSQVGMAKTLSGPQILFWISRDCWGHVAEDYSVAPYSWTDIQDLQDGQMSI
jgi:hypothetical protein